MANALEEARASLERVHTFDTSVLPRELDLGSELNFQEAVEPAQRIIDLFRQFPIQYIADIPPNRQTEIKNQADSFFNILDQINKFDPKTADAFGRRNSIINSLKSQYQGYFDSLFQLIAYNQFQNLYPAHQPTVRLWRLLPCLRKMREILSIWAKPFTTSALFLGGINIRV
jgi:hypothetical protein